VGARSTGETTCLGHGNKGTQALQVVHRDCFKVEILMSLGWCFISEAPVYAAGSLRKVVDTPLT
jgi:hypothetical protein